MPVLVAAVVVVGLLCVLDLLLTLGTIRRLREHSELLTKLTSVLRGDSSAVLSDPGVREGARVESFIATATSGEIVSGAALPAEALVGFFDPGCEPCEKVRPEFIRYAAGRPGGRDTVLAAISSRPDETPSPAWIAELDAVARVFVGPAAEAVQTAFGVSTWPTVCTVADGRITASGATLSALRAPAAV